MRRFFIIVVVLVLAAYIDAATPYHTDRLHRIATALNISVSDYLSVNAEIDSVAVYNKRNIHIKTNTFGEISHIGYNMFSSEMHALYDNATLLDFVERYLLELDLVLDGKNVETRMSVDQVSLVKGKMSTLYSITPNTDFSFMVENLKRHFYKLTWIISNGEEVCLSIPADCQLIIGANAIELEYIAEREIQRMIAITDDALLPDWSNAKMYRSGDLLIVDGGSYMNRMIRGDLYLTEQEGEPRLLCSPYSPNRSISNIMLTGIFKRELPMNLTINKYGNKKVSLDITLQQFISFCQTEKCKLYFGIKAVQKDVLSGTLFAYNEDLGYTHMLSVQFPLKNLQEENQPILSIAYVYIPLKNIDDKYFNQNYIPSNRYDEI